jgi:hypothetical protein
LRDRLGGCRGVLVDSNVLLDVATSDPEWSDWSASALAEAAEHTILVIDPIIYAEVSVGYSTIEALDAAFPAALYRCEPLPWEAGFLAGKNFLQVLRGTSESRMSTDEILALTRSETRSTTRQG